MSRTLSLLMALGAAMIFVIFLTPAVMSDFGKWLVFTLFLFVFYRGFRLLGRWRDRA